MGIEDAFARYREERVGRRLDALRFAAAEPESAGRIQVSNIAHAMIKTTVDGIGNLRLGRGLRTVPVASGHNWTLDHNLADLSRRHLQFVAPEWDRLVADADDLDGHALDRPANAHPGAVGGAQSCLTQDFVAANRAYRQRFGCTVRRVDLYTIREQRRETLNRLPRHGSTRGDNAPQRRQSNAARRSVSADTLNERGRAEQVGHAEIADSL